jgi:hypothetical protein
MTRRGKWLLAAGVTLGLVVVTCGGGALWMAVDADRELRDCTEQYQAVEKTVYESRKWTDKEIPGLGDYLEIRWMQKAAADPCSRIPSPTDWMYQGFAKLRAQDAADLHAGRSWQPKAPETIWPALLPFAPADARWLRTENDTGYHGDLYLDPTRGIAFFALFHG